MDNLIKGAVNKIKQFATNTYKQAAPVVSNFNNQMGKAYTNFAITPQKVQNVQKFATGAENYLSRNVVQPVQKAIFQNPITNTPLTSTIPFVGPQITQSLQTMGVKGPTIGQTAEFMNPFKVTDQGTQGLFPQSPVRQFGGMDQLIPKILSGDKKAMQEYQNKWQDISKNVAVGMAMGGEKPKQSTIRIPKEEKAIMAEFSRTVDEFGPKQNLGQLGADAQHIVEQYFGPKWKYLSNDKIKQMFDYALAKREGGLVVKPRGVELPAGLGTVESEGLASQALKAKPAQKVKVVNGKIKVTPQTPELIQPKIDVQNKLGKIMYEDRQNPPYPWFIWDKKMKRWIDPSVPDEALYGKKDFGLQKPKKDIPSFTKEQIDQEAARASFVTSENKGTFKELFGKWFGKRKASETSAVLDTQKFQIPKGVNGEEVIRYLEDPTLKVSPLTKNYTDQVKGKFDELYKEAKSAGIDVGYLKNYITHIWDRPPEEVAKLYKGASQKFKFSAGREFPTYEEGIKMGLTPKYTNPQQILAQYVNNLEKTKANIQFVKDLKAQGFLVSKKVPGFEPITAPGFVAPSIRLGDETIREGVYYAPPEIAQSINRIFSPEVSPLSGTAKVSSGLQDLALSGGVPLTPLNAWTFAQTQKEVMAGRVRGPLKALWTSLSEGGTQNYVKNNAKFVREQQLNNIPLSTSVNIDSMARDGIFKTLFKGKVGEAWHRMVNEPTFKRFMPVLQTEFYKDVRKSALQSGRSEEEAIKIATKATKNFYGLNSASDTALKSQLGKDFMSTVFFAPRYRESMINFWVKNLQSIANPLALENRANVKFMASAILTYLAMDKVNQLYNGRPMSENPKGKEDKVLIPLGDGYTLGVPFLSSIATIPRTGYKIGKSAVQGDFEQVGKEAKNLLSFGIKPPLDVLTNENYFGGQIYEPGSKDQAKDIGKYLLTQYQHPYLREAVNQLGGKQPTYQTFSKAMELPFRFYKDSAIKSGYYYDTKADVLKGMSKEDAAVLEKWTAKKKTGMSQAQSTQMSMAEALEKLARPDLLRKESQLRVQTAFKTKDPLDPFYTLTPEQQQTALRLQTFYPGDKQKSEMQTANIDWLKPYWAARTAYFDELTSKGIMKPMESSTLQASPELQKKLDYYYTLPYGTGARTAFIKQNQDLVQYWDQKAVETNMKREELGLAPIQATSGFSKFGSSIKKPKKVTIRKVKKGKTAKFKTIATKVKKLKTIKGPSFKVARTKQPKIKVKMPKIPKFA